MEKVFKFALDIKRYTNTEDIEVVSGDVGTNKFEIQLRENEISVVDITNLFCKIHFKKSDGKIVLQNATIKDASKGIIECILKSNTISAPGKTIAEVGIYASEDSQERLTSAIFSFIVRESIMSDSAIESTDEIRALDQLVQEFQDTKTAQDATFSASESARAETFNISESTRQVTFNTAEEQREIEFNQIKSEYEAAVNVDTNLEVVNAHRDLDGTVHDNLKTRIDADAQKVKTIDERLTQKRQVLLDPPLTTENPVQSVKDIEAGVASVVVPGLTLVNSIKNGDFSDGLSGWIDVRSNISHSSKSLTIECTDNTGSSYIRESTAYQTFANDKWFFYTKVKSIVGDCNIVLKFRDASTAVIDSKIAVDGKTVELYGLRTLVGYTASYLSIGIEIPSLIGDTIEVDGDAGVFAINMSALGIEDFTEEQMLALCRNGSFEGMQSRRGSLVESVNKNLFDAYSLKVNNNAIGIHIDGSMVTITDSINQSSFAYAEIYAEPGKVITISRQSANDTLYVYEDVIYGTQLSRIDAGATKLSTTIIVPTEGQFVIGLYNSKAYTTTYYDGIRVEEGAVAKDYIDHQHSNQQFQPLLGSVPNGERDEVDLMNGVMGVRTNVGKNNTTTVVAGTLSGYDNGKGANADLSFARLISFLSDNVGDTDRSGIGYDGNNLYRIVAESIDLISEHGIIMQNDGDVFIVVPTNLLPSDDLAGLQAYLDANQIQLIYQLAEPFQRDIEQVNPLATYAGYTQFISEVGKIPNEKAAVSINDAQTYYYINSVGAVGVPDSDLKYKVKKLDRVMFNGENIKELGIVDENFAYGNERWLLEKSVAEAHDIDTRLITLDYTTLETNGYKDVEVKYNVDLASAVSSNSQAISDIGEQVDRNTNVQMNQNLINLEFDVRLTALEP